LTKEQVKTRIFSFEKVKRCTAVVLFTIKSDFKIMAPVDEETQKQTRVLFLTVQSWTSKYKVGQRRRKEIFTRKLQWNGQRLSTLDSLAKEIMFCGVML
jgi:hypothetical protein